MAFNLRVWLRDWLLKPSRAEVEACKCRFDRNYGYASYLLEQAAHSGLSATSAPSSPEAAGLAAFELSRLCDVPLPKKYCAERQVANKIRQQLIQGAFWVEKPPTKPVAQTIEPSQVEHSRRSGRRLPTDAASESPKKPAERAAAKPRAKRKGSGAPL